MTLDTAYKDITPTRGYPWWSSKSGRRRRDWDPRAWPAGRPHGFEHRLRFQALAGAAAVRNVAHLPVAIVRVVAQVMTPQRDQTAGEPPSRDSRAQRAGEHLGKECQDLDDHAYASSGRSTVIIPSAGAIERTTLRIIGINTSRSPPVTRSTSFAG